ncbi:hypothetical protein TWF696_003466 [Orbilia brochopaga]|uniref:Zn(2)-C6 fungal-type domain-containing protein n=1 Tax=Orbilia brochopaga TaxID=3140254 RepID=A0AAV9U1G7_9PEZI
MSSSSSQPSSSSSKSDMRGRRDTQICNNCRRDKQKCVRYPDDDGSQVCVRCEKYSYTNCSTDPSVQPMERKKRVLNDLKCDKCRKDHKTCTFSYGPWPNPCDRCARTTSQCSAPTRPSRTRNSRGTSTQDSGSDCHSTIAASEYSDYTEYASHQDMEYTTGYEEEYYNWATSEGHQQWHDHYTHHMYPIDYTSPFSPDSGSSDYSEGGASPFAMRR